MTTQAGHTIGTQTWKEGSNVYLNITTDATSTAARFRMSVLCPEMVGGSATQGRRIADFDVFGYGTVVPAASKGATSGVGAWSPPV